MTAVRKRQSLTSYEVNSVDSRLTEEDFAFFRDNMRRLCGVSLSVSKASLIESRLRKRLVALNMASFKEYRAWVMAEGPGSPEWQHIVNSLTTHTTEWFREGEHFQELREEYVPEWKALNPGRPLRVWSVACSTGEEPYSIALVLNQMSERFKFDYEITATDIDTNVLGKARAGLYNVDDLARIPQEYHRNALAKGVGSKSHLMRVRDHIRDRVSFAQANITALPTDFPTQYFDILFCRNVFIYFSPEVIVDSQIGV